MSTPISPLSFDSSLFAYPVGKFEAGDLWNEASFLNQVKDFHLVYIFSKKPIEINSDRIYLSDTKFTFEKQLDAPREGDPEIKLYSGELNEQLLSLALESGVYSRFKTDPGFKNGEFEKLYKLWIQNALNQKEVWVAKNLAGFVSCHLSGTESSIGLIAVDKNQRGKGWAKRLVKAAENFAFLHGAQTLKIGTQIKNNPAVNLYQSLGYELVDKVFVYHYWKS